MNTAGHRFSLEPYKSHKQKHACPSCGKRSYVRYIDEETREYLPEEFGKCDRADRCGYSLNPYKEGYHKQDAAGNNTAGAWAPVRTVRKPMPRPEQARPIMYLPINLLRPALSPEHWPANNLFQFLAGRYGAATVREAFERYRVGTSSRWSGATVLPLFDETGCVGGQIVQFDSGTGKTVRWQHGEASGRNTTWLYRSFSVDEYPDRALYEEKADKYPFLFGLHLALETPGRTICVVEAPKTAIICSIVYPQFLWLAVGALSWLNADRMKRVRNRNIVLVPDGGAGEIEWQQRAADLRGKGFRIDVALLGLPSGDDVADVITDTLPTRKPVYCPPAKAPLQEAADEGCAPESGHLIDSAGQWASYNTLLNLTIAKQFDPAKLGFELN